MSEPAGARVGWWVVVGVDGAVWVGVAVLMGALYSMSAPRLATPVSRALGRTFALGWPAARLTVTHTAQRHSYGGRARATRLAFSYSPKNASASRATRHTRAVHLRLVLFVFQCL